MLCYTEIKHSDWFKLVIELRTANQSAMFQCRVATLHLKLFLTSSPGPHLPVFQPRQEVIIILRTAT